MAEESKRSRLRMDIPNSLVRAARARAGFDGVDPNIVIARALEVYLKEELEILKRKEGDKKGDRLSPGMLDLNCPISDRTNER